MERAQKVEAVDAYKGIFAGAGSVVIAHYSGLTVAEMTSLRAELRKSGGQLKVVKNRLAKIALKGSPAEGAADMFTGPVAIAYAEDPVAAPKATADFAKKNEKLVLIGGFMDVTVLDEGQVKALATMPSLDELRGKLIGLIQAPATKVAGVVQAPAGQLARLLQAYADKQAA
ncbi:MULTISPECIES: 50S ribosomal protein L10 [Glycocaulis]|jgi:large subunit ribosomal protein L10|nr:MULTISPECIES: 50S ribosomal protein L10 [Glycocaulis]MBV5258166.1 50S ribosomal protein L10 [Synechococcus moorigangaii CMS01]GGB86755.1 50S ribosomal protein L10 [Glycocaulis alkaliphilus]GGH07874.1 50S ribosomal protein L10 [Glycocaulis albus]HCY55892.1 50S ribosomal protein L10 [Oceanicaulis sp.]